jgi:hypothetical protein
MPKSNVIEPVSPYALPVLRFIARRRAERVPAAGDGPVDPFVPFR